MLFIVLITSIIALFVSCVMMYSEREAISKFAFWFFYISLIVVMVATIIFVVTAR